jgi:hypothetical protein
MKKLRNIPFGYQLSDGEIAFHQQEANAVKMIFNEYLHGGLSYKDITELLTDKRIPYRENKSIWNKSMVKRILENAKYMGTEDYSMLVSEADFQLVASIKAKRNQNGNTSSAIIFIKKKSLCFECGGRYKRHTKNPRKEKWYCENGCQSETRITDSLLQNILTSVLNEVIVDSSILNIESTLSFKPNLEIIRLINEINRMIEKKELDKDNVKALIMVCAAEKYATYDDCTAPYKTEVLKALLKGKRSLAEFNVELFNKVVENFLIEKNGVVHVRFINQKVITYHMK